MELTRTVKEIINDNLKIKPEEFANEVIKWCKIFNIRDLTNLKLQKLVYYCYCITVWSLEKMPFDPMMETYYFSPQGNDKRRAIEFWKFGPVITPLYCELKNFGSALIKHDDDYDDIMLKNIKNEMDIDEKEYNDKVKIYSIRTNDIIKEENKDSISRAVRYTLIAIGDLSAGKLVEKSHSPQSAWEYFYSKNNKKTTEMMLAKMLEEIKNYNYFDDLFEEKKDNYK